MGNTVNNKSNRMLQVDHKFRDFCYFTFLFFLRPKKKKKKKLFFPDVAFVFIQPICVVMLLILFVLMVWGDSNSYPNTVLLFFVFFIHMKSDFSMIHMCSLYFLYFPFKNVHANIYVYEFLQKKYNS